MTEPRESGVALAQQFFVRVVRPLLAERAPDIPVIAARLGTGSDVLGFDDDMSRDHDWGLRLNVFVPPGDVGVVRRILDEQLPAEFLGHPTRFAFSGDSEERHHVDVETLERFTAERLGFDPRSRATVADWLSVTGQSILELTAGRVFADPFGELTALRQALDWYPDDLWRYLIACDFGRIDQELPLLGRAADRGDALGADLIGARIAHAMMHLSFLANRTWWPYAKWFGTAWAQLPDADDLLRPLRGVIAGDTAVARNTAAEEALTLILWRLRARGLSTVDEPALPFWDRPYIRPNPEIVDQLRAGIREPSVRDLPLGVGSVEQRTDNVDILVSVARRRDLVGAERLG
ncbi:DUF4037 domain-containing protein [Curtobacterium ammoniigenes]|uniref:DUF4037 domain-containing protein n=1 Tax=Curtobacterium ammoniigenes TaxID=395387 RepID=UPI001FDF0A01|nr:DUF4037 domain-containing protein [Curtobacterium ammoniigenes]